MTAYREYGTDSSGRLILMTPYMHRWWEGVVERLGFRPTITQGAFMSEAGGGAAASEGYHDFSGCLDLRVWDLTDRQVVRVVRELRRSGAAAWLRDAQHGGMEEHIHLVLGTDEPLSSGAIAQWKAYQAGRDGLASNGADYHWRPDPLNLRVPVKTRGERIDAAIRKVAADIDAREGEPNRTRRVALRALRAIPTRWAYQQ